MEILWIVHGFCGPLQNPIHDKTHLTDDVRIIQLRMRIKGEAERAPAGLVSKGTMYATALKSLKEQFGQPSVIARAVVNKLTKGKKNNEKQQANSAGIFSRHHKLFGHYASPRLLRRHQRQ